MWQGLAATIHCERLAPPMKNCGGLPREPLPWRVSAEKGGDEA